MALTEFGLLSWEHRRRKNIRLGDQAKALGMSSALLSSIEHGRRKIPPGFPNKVANYLRLDPNDRSKLTESAWLGKQVIKLEVARPEEAMLIKLIRENLNKWSSERLEEIIGDLT